MHVKEMGADQQKARNLMSLSRQFALGWKIHYMCEALDKLRPYGLTAVHNEEQNTFIVYEIMTGKVVCKHTHMFEILEHIEETREKI